MTRADEMLASLIAAVPFLPSEALRVVDLGCGDGRLASAVLHCFPDATLIALDGSESLRAEATRRLASFGQRARVAPFDLAGLEWWELLFGVDVVISSLTVHDLNDVKKQYLYKAVADRASQRGALLIADRAVPPLFHQLVWLRHAGFKVVDCWWVFAGHAVFGGYKEATPAPAGVSYADALAAITREADRPASA